MLPRKSENLPRGFEFAISAASPVEAQVAQSRENGARVLRVDHSCDCYRINIIMKQFAMMWTSPTSRRIENSVEFRILFVK